MSLNAGMRYGPYEIRRQLGAGGMGAVFEAWDARLQRPVALKVVSAEFDSGTSHRQLLHEARAAAALNHPNICTIYDVGEIDGTPFIAMELIEGQTLRTLVSQGPLPPERVSRLGRQLAGALACAHDAGVIHGDLKSANVMVTADGRVKVLDFGIARHLSAPSAATRTATAAERVVGTVPYMAPETLSGRPTTVRSDVWALGIVLFEMCAGRLPFDGDTSATLSASILRDRLPALPDGTPPGLMRVIGRCLEKEEALRPGSAGEVALGLDIADPLLDTAATLTERRRRQALTVVMPALVVALLGTAVASWWSRSTVADDSKVEAIAVLPFANLSGDPDQEYFADGVTEAVITDLGKIGALRVIARGSVMQYRKTPKSPADAARELGVDALVDGSVLRIGDRVRITAQIIAPEGARVLWSDRYDRDMRDILALHADIATAIARQVRATIATSEAERLAVPYSPDPKAYERYLLGRYHAYRKNPESAKRAVDYLVEATTIDPGFALAYATLAEAYRLREIWGGARAGSFVEQSRDAAQRALALDPRLPEGHVARAIDLSERDWNWPAAEAEFRLAIDAGPSLSYAYAEYSFLLQGLKRFDEAIAAARRATALDPLSPDHLSQEGRALFRARRYGEAEASFTRALELDPSFGSALSRLIDLYLATGRLEDAAALLQPRQRALGEARSQTAQLQAMSGQLAAARALLKEMDSEVAVAGGGGSTTALVLVALGDHDEALRRLEHAVERRQLMAFSLRDPRFDPIAGTARFARILERMNLPK